MVVIFIFLRGLIPPAVVVVAEEGSDAVEAAAEAGGDQPAAVSAVRSRTNFAVACAGHPASACLRSFTRLQSRC